MDKIKQRPNLGYLIAGIGALVALLAFLLFPYAMVTASVSGTALGVSVHENSTLTLNATAIAQSLATIFNSPQIQNQGALWLLPILALVALVLTGLVLFRDYPFGKGIKAPLAMQRRWGNYGLIGVATLSVLLQIVLLSSLSSQIQNVIKAPNSLPSTITANVSTGTLAGFWLFLLGMAAVAAGAILLLVQESKQLQTAQAMPNMSGGQPYQPYPPQQPQAYPPQQQNPYSPQPYQPYPPQQPQAYPPQQQAPYPPQQPQQYSSQQWPPSSNQPPYPPGQ